MSSEGLKHVFGPVPSRRLGRSLGVDVVPYKTCTYDCVYCQIGRTTDHRLERGEWMVLEEVLEEVRAALERKPDYVTISGSGDPTLYSRLGELIRGIKAMTKVPVAVLTNGALLWMPEVRRDVMEADLVVPSLDAGTERTFLEVNRPVAGISFEKMVEGLVQFSKEYSGKVWLEVFLVEGMTATSEEVAEIVKIAERMKPDRVQLNTVVRPPAEEFARKVPKEKMMVFARMFKPRAEVIVEYEGTYTRSEFEGRREDVLELLKRRPCTVPDIVVGLGMHRNEVVKYVDKLVDKGKAVSEVRDDAVYYKAT